jgi:hypothetical protein
MMKKDAAKMSQNCIILLRKRQSDEMMKKVNLSKSIVFHSSHNEERNKADIFSPPPEYPLEVYDHTAPDEYHVIFM